MRGKKKLVKTLRDMADLIENNTDYKHSIDRFYFYKVYRETNTLLTKYIKLKKLENKQNAIEL